MIIYHELSREALEKTLRYGLKRTEQGRRSDDAAIIRTDRYLDERRPTILRKNGLSRSKNLYAYLGDTKTIIDIKDGATVPLDSYLTEQDSVLLRLDISPLFCYVADLDRYDHIKSALSKRDEARTDKLSREYWNTIIPLPRFRLGDIARPEVMIVRNIPPEELTVLHL